MTEQQLAAMRQALEAFEDLRDNHGIHYVNEIVDLRKAIEQAQPAPVQEPVAFEEWLAKQHGDPEEIGFLQALRIAYIAGQDSTTPPAAQPAEFVCSTGLCHYHKPLTDEQIVWLVPGLLDCLCDPYDCDKSGDQYASIPKDMVRLARAIEQAHGITGETK